MSTREELKARLNARKSGQRTGSTREELKSRLDARLTTKKETAKTVSQIQEEQHSAVSNSDFTKTMQAGNLIAQRTGFSPALPFGAQMQMKNAALKKHYEEVVKPKQVQAQANFDRLVRSENQIAEREIKNEISAMQNAHPEWHKDTLYLAAFGGEDFADAGVFDLETWDVYKNLPDTYDGIKNNVITKEKVAGWRAQGYSDKDIADHLRLYAENAADFQNTVSDALINKHLTQKEKYAFLRVWEEKGRDAAEEFLNSLRDTAAAREGAQIYSDLDSGFDKRLYQYKYGLKKGLQGFEAMGYASDLKSSVTADDAASGLIYEDSLNEDGSKSRATYVDMGLMSLGQMTPSMIAGAIPGVGGVARILTTLGTSGGSTMIEDLRSGKDYDSALMHGLLSGSSEAGLDFVFGSIGKGTSKLFSKLSGDALGKASKAIFKASPKVAKIFGAIGKHGGNILGEFIEEYSQEILDPVFRNIVFDEKNEVKLFTAEALEAGILGGVMGGIFDGFSTAVNAVGKVINDHKAIKSMTDKGLSKEAAKAILKEYKAALESDTIANHEHVPDFMKAVYAKDGTTYEAANDIDLPKKVDPQVTSTDEPTEEAKRSSGFKNALVSFFDKIASKNFQQGEKLYFENVSDKASSDIKNILGIDVSGWRTAIEARMADHILKRHGINGKQDHSMENKKDIARIYDVLNSYDSMEYGGKTSAYSSNAPGGKHRQADTVLYEKQYEDGTVYVVEAVPDTNAKTLYVVTAYKKTETSETARADNIDLGETSKNENQSISATNSIPQSAEKSQEGVRDDSPESIRETLSENGQAAFDIAMENATDKDTAARQFRIKYLEGEMGKAFSVDEGSELTSVMQKAAYKYGAEAKASLGTVTYNTRTKVSDSLSKSFEKAAKDLNVHITYGGKAPVVNGVQDRAYITSAGELRIYEDVEVRLADGRVLKGDDAATMVILGHEMTHRLQALDEKSYNAFREFVLARKSGAIEGYMKMGLSQDAAADEIVADYAMTTLFADQKTINEVTKKYSKLAEAVRDILEWIKTKLGIKSSELDRAIRLWNNAYNASVRNAKSGAEIKNTADGDVKYSRVGYTQSGIEVYETSDEVKALSYHDRKARFLDIMTNQYRGRTARFVRNGHTYYAIFAKDDLNKNIYGDKKSDKHGQKAKINVGADGAIFDLVENSSYDGSEKETGKNIKSHKNIKHWDYFVKTVQIDGRVYDLIANIRKSSDNQYVYSLQLNENKNIGAAPPLGTTNGASNRVLTAPNNNVPQNVPVVNTQSMQNSQNNADTDKKSVTGTEELLFESEAEKAQHVADNFDLSGVENYKAVGSMERMSGIANSVAKAHRVNKDGRAKLAKALEKGVQNMRKASLAVSKNQPSVHSPTVFANANTKTQDFRGKSDDAKVKQTAAEGFLEAAMIISPDADVKAQVEIANALAESVWAEMTTDRLTDTIRSIRDEAINAARADVRAERLAALGEKYGTIKPGERPSRAVTLPKKTSEGKKVSQTARTVMEAEATPDEMIPTLEQMVADGEFSYETITDKGAVAKAENKITKQGFDATVREWFKAVGSGKVSKDNTALGWTIYNNAANSGDTELAVEVLCEMVKYQRNAAQALQATRILKKLSPSGQLYAAQKSVQGLQEELEERYGDKAPELKIDPTLADKVINGETEAECEKALADLYRDIGRQMPSSVMDKWNAWRYLSMLGNARTHIRNIVGNAGFAPVVTAKNITATGIESLVSFVSRGKIGRTKAFLTPTKTDRTLLAAAWADYDAVADAALGQSKYNDNQFANKHIEDGRRIFKFKPLEVARRGNSWLLDKEDSWFSKPQYANALAQYCKANGITAQQIQSGKDLEKARAYAIKEAQKATYRDTNAFSELFSKLGKIDERGEYKLAKRIWNRGVEGVLPFRKTPANILARGIEYSPIGLGGGVKNLLFDVKSGKVTAAEAIDKMSAGLTGSGLMALGAFLVTQGVLRGFGGDDEKEKEYMELMGHQQYALEIGGTSVTLDWLAPEALPFFVGATIAEQTMQDGEMTVEGLISALGSISDPMLSMSCLQGLNDLIESVSFSDTSGVVTIAASAATSYLTQGVPTLFGQVERTSEPERMMTYTTKGDKVLTPDMQYTLGKVSAKLPGDYSQIPYIDAWGRTEASGNVGVRAANNMLNPAYVSNINESDMEKELLRLYEQSGEPVLPSRADKSFPIDGEQVYLTAEQYQKYATSKGKRSHRILTALTKSDVYKDLDDFTKAEIVSKVYTYSNAIAKSGCGAKNSGNKGYALDGWVSKAYDACVKYGIDEATYIAAYVMAGSAGKYVSDGETVTNSPGLCIMQTVYSIPGLSQEQYDAMFVNFGVGSKVRGYDKNTVAGKIAEFESDNYEYVEG